MRAVEVRKYLVRLEGTLPGIDVEALSDLGDAVMEALIDAGVEDPCVDGDVESGHFGVEVVVEARTENDALSRGVQLMNGALETIRLVDASAHTEDLVA